MNRVIKFRAWHLDDGMVYFDFDTFKKDYHDQYGNIMQFTGLTDRNGTEIYEGDIVSEKWRCSVISDPNTGAYVVKFWNNPKRNKTCSLYQYLEMRELAGTSERDNVIIGNIHQNPELLNA